QNVLKINPNSEEARQFLLKLEQRRSGGAATPVSGPQSRSVSLSEGVPVEPASMAGPRIQQLRVDGKLLSGMNASQLQAVQPQSTLFVSLEYKDFSPGQSQLEAALFNSKGKQ